jgi:hypothetical protein
MKTGMVYTAFSFNDRDDSLFRPRFLPGFVEGLIFKRESLQEGNVCRIHSQIFEKLVNCFMSKKFSIKTENFTVKNAFILSIICWFFQFTSSSQLLHSITIKKLPQFYAAVPRSIDEVMASILPPFPTTFSTFSDIPSISHHKTS